MTAIMMKFTSTKQASGDNGARRNQTGGDYLRKRTRNTRLVLTCAIFALVSFLHPSSKVLSLLVEAQQPHQLQSRQVLRGAGGGVGDETAPTCSTQAHIWWRNDGDETDTSESNNDEEEELLKRLHQQFTQEWNDEYTIKYAPNTLLNQDELITTLPTIPSNSNINSTVVPNLVYWRWVGVGPFRGFQGSAYTTDRVTDDVVDHIEGTYPISSKFNLGYTHPQSLSNKHVTETQIILDHDNKITHYVAFFSLFPNEYQHVLIDHLGYIAYLRELYGQDPTTKLILLATNELRSIVTHLDPVFASDRKVHWTMCQEGASCKPRLKIMTPNARLSVLETKSSTRHGALLNMARDWIAERYPYSSSPHMQRNEQEQERYPEGTIVYYTRHAWEQSPDTSSEFWSGGNTNNNANTAALPFHGRQMDIHQEHVIINTIQNYMKRLKRKERLVIFDGTAPFHDQIELFQKARVIIGPHGGGLANILLTAAYDDAGAGVKGQDVDCASRPKVLEFATSPDTPQIQEGQFAISYHTLYAQAPWVEYHQLFFDKTSSAVKTFVDMNTFRRALTYLLDDNHDHDVNMMDKSQE
jgi:hypothetical protein